MRLPKHWILRLNRRIQCSALSVSLPDFIGQSREADAPDTPESRKSLLRVFSVIPHLMRNPHVRLNGVFLGSLGDSRPWAEIWIPRSSRSMTLFMRSFNPVITRFIRVIQTWPENGFPSWEMTLNILSSHISRLTFHVLRLTAPSLSSPQRIFPGRIADLP
jgi:hypothetical protein